MTRWMQGLVLAAALAGCGEPDGATARSPDRPAPAPAQTADAPPVADRAPEQRNFTDWRVVCDNGDACVAYAGGDDGWIRVALGAGPAATPSVVIGLWPDDDHPPVSASLVLDGAALPLVIGRGESFTASIPPARVAAAIAALARARTLSIQTDARTAALSPSGVSAALLWIDERQGRLDTVTALIRRGPRPAAAVPAALALPTVTAAPAVAQTGFEGAQRPLADDPARPLKLSAALEALPVVRQCRENTVDQPALRDAVMAARLGPDTELWGVPCDSGAYNASYMMFVTGPAGTNPHQAVLPDPDPRNAARASWWGDGALVNPVYDPATRTLSHFPHGRGLGDCGVIQTWTWTAHGFAMKEARAMGECWGMPSDLWPTTWRTR